MVRDSTPVAVFRSRITVSGTTAPVASRTVPLIEAFEICAYACRAARFVTVAQTVSLGLRAGVPVTPPRTVDGRQQTSAVLQIDSHAYAARTFTEAGLVASQANAMTQLGGRVADLFGGTKAQPRLAESELTAESLEVEFIDPAKHSDVVRREMIDRIGAVARANKTAATATLTSIAVANDIPLQVAGIYACAFASGPLDPALPIRRLSLTDGLLEDLQALRKVRPAQNASLSSEDHERVNRILDKYPALLQSSAESALVISQRLARGLRIGDASTLFYEATPRLVIASFDLTTGLALDLRRNTVRALARKSSGSELVRANLARSPDRAEFARLDGFGFEKPANRPGSGDLSE
jgi:hypothetical protein